MKNSIKMIIIMMLIGIRANRLMAQNENVKSGIYLTAQDYKADKLSYVPEEGTKLKLNDFLGGNHISLTSAGKKIRLSKSEIFGYRDGGKDYRLYQDEAYEVIDTAGFILYCHVQLVPQGKGYARAENYFYSTGIAAPVLNLTIANVYRSFPEQNDFRYSIRNYFHGDADLMAYDSINREYQIKYLYFEHQHAKGTQHASL
ncbi:hypothetical protein MTO98_21620 [Mucilaginibacter sp. SMC90]|uniref:hypothetical protein n=1 Tax=Mucilaginibacter sp. SMC90 TaxID=2929803 RepID=UPI001FB4221D|nr:hypothetical protein [Mucilaginibacter sp. SMC90]UOE47005.1 hypothetical protein MTO98_21620 [Mucilaginibacter sp. SMC90]